MTEIKAKVYDLENRTLEFAYKVRDLVNQVRYYNSNREYATQLIRSSGSVAANYIEANEALSRKDFKNRIKICRKEAKESTLWLKLIELKTTEQNSIRVKLGDEAKQLVLIFNAIINKTL